jgi:hypothetical protein
MAGGFGNPMMPFVPPPNNVPLTNPDSECASANIHVRRTTPIIYFVVDGSGSMCEPFNGPTRWQALRTALLDPMNGVVYRLQQVAEFGLMIYDGTIDPFLALTGIGSGGMMSNCNAMDLEQKAMGECPLLVEVSAALNNAAALDMAYPAGELGGSTPTDKALTTLVDRLIAETPVMLDADPQPRYIVLATDGAPNDICMGGQGGNGVLQQQGVLAAVDRAAAASMKTFVISLAGNDAALQTHLDQVADHGDPNTPDAHTFNPETPEDLVNDIIGIVGGAVGCEIVLEGRVEVGKECSGTVEMNGNRLPCCIDDGSGFACDQTPMTDPDGWRLKDPSVVELVGQTCISFLEATGDTMLRAAFPCDIYVE